MKGIIQSLKDAPQTQAGRPQGKVQAPRGNPTKEDSIRCDADAAFFVKCKYLGRTSRWMSYNQTVELRNDLYRTISKFRRSGLAGEELFTASILFFTCLGMGQRAHAVFDMALEDGIRPNSRMYNFLLGAYANEGKWKMVYQLWTQMVRNDILPTPHSFNLLLRAQQKGGNKLQVFELMNQMSEIMKPNSMTWTILLSAATTYSESVLLLADMKRHDLIPDNRTIGAVLDACVLAGDVNNAEALARRAEREWGVPFTTGTYNTLINVYKEIGDFEGVNETIRRMQLAGCRPDTLSYNLLLTSAALNQDVHLGRTAFMEAESLGVSRTLHMNTAITAVFGYSGDYANAQRCWEARPGRGPSAKRTEAQVQNIRECCISARMLLYKHRTQGLMSEMYRMRDPTLIDCNNPYLLLCLLRTCFVLRGWGIRMVWRTMCQVRTPKQTLAAIDTRRHQAILHIAIDCLLVKAVFLWIHDHPNISNEMRAQAERDPTLPTGIVNVDLMEDVFDRAFKRGPSMASKLVGPLIASYAALNMPRRAMYQYRKLLVGDASVRNMQPHVLTMRDMFEAGGDTEAVALCNSNITRYHDLTLWRVPANDVLKSLAADGGKPSDATFQRIREKQTRQQQSTRRKQREAEMIINGVPGEKDAQEDYLVGVVSDQLPFISPRLNAVDQQATEGEGESV